MEEKREREEKEFNILFWKITNEPKVSYNDVTSPVYRAEITLFFLPQRIFVVVKLH